MDEALPRRILSEWCSVLASREVEEPKTPELGYCGAWMWVFAVELRDGSGDALVVLLSSQVQSLEYLHLGCTFIRQSAFTGLMLPSAICEPGTYQLGDFQQLQELSFLRLKYRDETCDQNSDK